MKRKVKEVYDVDLFERREDSGAEHGQFMVVVPLGSHQLIYHLLTLGCH